MFTILWVEANNPKNNYKKKRNLRPLSTVQAWGKYPYAKNRVPNLNTKLLFFLKIPREVSLTKVTTKKKFLLWTMMELAKEEDLTYITSRINAWLRCVPTLSHRKTGLKMDQAIAKRTFSGSLSTGSTLQIELTLRYIFTLQ